MRKHFTYAVLLASMLTLAACEETPEDKMESAKENATEAMKSLGDAARDTGEALKQKSTEVMEETNDKAKEVIDGQ